jgi:long-chain fatty acid transport protein
MGDGISSILIRIAGMTLASLLLAVGETLAGGYAIPQQTAKGLGLSNAFTAGVDDPSAVYYNPAALTEVDGNKLVGTLNYINVQSSVKNSGNQSNNRSNHNFFPTFFGNLHIPDTDFTLGLGFYAPFGLSVSYDDDALTRYAVIDADLSTYNINLALGWRPSEIIAIGAGVSYVGAYTNLSRAIYLDAVLGFPGPSSSDASAEINGRTDTATFNLGLLLKHPKIPVKFGLTYRGRAFLDLDGFDVKFQDSAILGGTQTRTEVSDGSIVLPMVVSAGINWQINPKWSLEFVYDWTKWNDLQNLQLKFEDNLPAAGGAVPIPQLTVSADWKNTSTLRLGTLFQLNKTWDFMAGIAVDETPIPNNTLNPIIPGADILALNAGVAYTWRMLKLTFSYMAVFYQDRTVQNDMLEAEQTAIPAQPFTPGPDKYETFNNFVSLGLRYRF